jgi:hypothetical protein
VRIGEEYHYQRLENKRSDGKRYYHDAGEPVVKHPAQANPDITAQPVARGRLAAGFRAPGGDWPPALDPG